MKLVTLLSVLFWHRDLRGPASAGCLLSMPVSLVMFLIIPTEIKNLLCSADVVMVVLTETVPLRTVNRQCSSGLQAVADVAAAIKAGFYDIGKRMDSSVFDYIGLMPVKNLDDDNVG